MVAHFFNEQHEQSEVKSQIVADYFVAWTTVMASRAQSNKLAYIDLFSGPGRYSDGSKSTPIKVLKHIIGNPRLAKKMVCIFNDANPDFVHNLKTEIDNIPGINSLVNKPKVNNSTIDDEIAESLEKVNLVPTLAFIDPWGYKGLTSRLIAAFIKDWGCDCIFFFNYNRINMGLTNPLVIEHMNSLYGEDRASVLRNTVMGMLPDEREQVILNELAETLSNNRSNFVLPFRFIRPRGQRTSHYLILVTKHPLGYTIMKQIMYRYSTDHDDGVASFSYIPTLTRQLSLLSLLSRPLDNLGDELCEHFAARTVTVQQIHDEHQVNTPFILQNYQEALRRLEEEHRIACNPSQRRLKNGVKTMGTKTLITFP
jgi:three-Cys-motif partner protein